VSLRRCKEIMLKDEGIPLLCDYTFPDAFADSTITARSDASLNEEWSGFGCYIIVPDKGATTPHQLRILAFSDKWSTAEATRLGHNTAAAEGIGLIMANRIMARMRPWRSHHTHFLKLTDALAFKHRLDNLKQGSPLMDGIRDECLATEAGLDGLDSRSDHIPRDFNVGSDLLSKGRPDLFQATLRAAGLPMACMITIDERDRDIAELLSLATGK
jgi:hypothetical protein